MALEIFTEPDHYNRYRISIHRLSGELAALHASPHEPRLEAMARYYSTNLAGQALPILEGNILYRDFFNSITSLLRKYTREEISAQQVLARFATLLKEIESRAASSQEMVSDVISTWMKSIAKSSRPPIFRRRGSTKASQQKSIVCRVDSLVPSILGPTPETKATQTLRSGSSSILATAIPEFIKSSGGEIERRCAAVPGAVYARLPFDYHINLSEVAYRLLKNSAKLVPIIVALCTLELPGELVAVAETAKEIISHITKLREEKGELCLYEAIVFWRAKNGTYPTVNDLGTELQELEVLKIQCKFFDADTPSCSIRSKDVQDILNFLEKKKVVKKISANEWWVAI